MVADNRHVFPATLILCANCAVKQLFLRIFAAEKYP